MIDQVKKKKETHRDDYIYVCTIERYAGKEVNVRSMLMFSGSLSCRSVARRQRLSRGSISRAPFIILPQLYRYISIPTPPPLVPIYRLSPANWRDDAAPRRSGR